MKKCTFCNKKLNLFYFIHSYYENNKQITPCKKCYDIEVEKDRLKERKKEEQKTTNKVIERQIQDLESTSGAVVALVIFGILGLFVYGGGIILLIAAAIVSSNRKSKAVSLRAQLETIQQTKKQSIKTSTKQEPLDILKTKFAEGTITEEEYNKKKKILKND